MGNWYATNSEKERTLTLSPFDSVLPSTLATPKRNELSGNYFYRYGDKGYQGTLELKVVAANHVAFSIFSVTNEARGRNIAEVPMDTVMLDGNRFVYQIPESDSCAFQVRLFHGFAVIEYTRGYCPGQFGLNATVDGIFLKVDSLP